MQSLPGVANIEIDANTFTVVVSGDTKTFDLENAVAALSKCGFPAEESKSLTGL